MSINRIARLCALLSILAFTITINAQTDLQKKFLREDAQIQKEDKSFFKPFGRGFALSSLIYWGGSLSDTFSTGDLYERNSLFRRDNGRLHKGKALAATSLVYGGTLIIEKKWPRFASFARVVIGGVRFVVAVNNWRK